MSRVPYQLLELNIISAQDLSPVSKNLKTYAVTWVNPDRKLRTRIDHEGQTNPTWNEKFVFRVDNRTLNSETSSLMIEIYAQGWLRDTPVGSVSVLVANLIPLSVRQERSSRRFVALQIRRPSGRPQGILNMGVSLLDNTMYSMPLYKELVSSPSAGGIPDLTEKKLQKGNNNNKMDRLSRSMSDKTDLTSKCGGGKKTKGAGSACDGSIRYYQGSLLGDGVSVLNGVGSSMVNGSVCISDVGPSASVVAAAVACGLYPTQLGPPPKPGSSVLEDWKVEESSMEGLKSKMERWKLEIPQKHDRRYQRLENGRRKGRSRRRRSTDPGDGTRLYTCFGNACGCELRLVCGKGGKKNRGRGRSSSTASVSEVN